MTCFGKDLWDDSSPALAACLQLEALLSWSRVWPACNWLKSHPTGDQLVTLWEAWSDRHLSSHMTGLALWLLSVPAEHMSSARSTG